jgi:hypothetical protein
MLRKSAINCVGNKCKCVFKPFPITLFFKQSILFSNYSIDCVLYIWEVLHDISISLSHKLNCMILYG